MWIGRNTVEVWHVARIEKRGGDSFLEKIDTIKVSHVTTSSKIHAVQNYHDKQVYQKQIALLQYLDATGSVDSRVVYAGGAQTLAKFFYDRNGHGRGEVLLTLDVQLRLHDTLRNYARTLEIANKKVSEVVELWCPYVKGTSENLSDEASVHFVPTEDDLHPRILL